MFQKTPAQMLLTAISNCLLLGGSLWVTLLVNGALALRHGTQSQEIITIGPLHLTTIERITNGSEHFRIIFTAELFWYGLCWVGCGLLWWLLQQWLHKYKT